MPPPDSELVGQNQEMPLIWRKPSVISPLPLPTLGTLKILSFPSPFLLRCFVLTLPEAPVCVVTSSGIAHAPEGPSPSSGSYHSLPALPPRCTQSF